MNTDLFTPPRYSEPDDDDDTPTIDREVEQNPDIGEELPTNMRGCASCDGPHHIQDCPQLRAAVRSALTDRPHTIRDIAALLRLARDLRVESGDERAAGRVMGQVAMLCQEYVLSDHTCRCGAHLDRRNRCPDCIRTRWLRRRVARTARRDWLIDY